MRAFAKFMHQELGLPGNTDEITDICEGTDRFSMYKVGPVLSISVRYSTQLFHHKDESSQKFSEPSVFSLFTHYATDYDSVFYHKAKERAVNALFVLFV